MDPITLPVPPEIAAALSASGSGRTVTLTDSEGRPVGLVLTPEQYQEMHDPEYMKMFIPPTREELDRAIAEGGEHSMEEVFQLLEKE